MSEPKQHCAMISDLSTSQAMSPQKYNAWRTIDITCEPLIGPQLLICGYQHELIHGVGRDIDE